MKTRRTIAAAAFALIAALPAAAGMLVSFDGASGPGLDSMSFNSIDNITMGNDNVVGPSSNIVWINQKAFSSSQVIDMEFTVVDDGAPTTEYVFYEGVFNGTPDPWIGYQIKLGFGTGAGFVSVGLGTGLDFDAPDFDSPMSFPPFTLGAFDDATINAVSATVPPGAFMNFAFSVDIPDWVTNFTIRQEPRIDAVAAEEASWGDVKTLFR